MSDADLIKQLEQANMQLKGLGAQLEATKQILNENLNSNMILRSHMILLQQDCKEANVKNEILNKQVNGLTSQLLELKPPQPAVNE